VLVFNKYFLFYNNKNKIIYITPQDNKIILYLRKKKKKNKEQKKKEKIKTARHTYLI
jgi:hypothetical protein